MQLDQLSELPREADKQLQIATTLLDLGMHRKLAEIMLRQDQYGSQF